MSCDGGYPLVVWTEGIAISNGSGFILGTNPDGAAFNWDELVGGDVRCHTSGFKSLVQPAGTATFKIYLTAVTASSPLIGDLIATFPVTGTGMFYQFSSTVPKPSGLKRLVWEVTGSGYGAVSSIDGLVLALEVT